MRRRSISGAGAAQISLRFGLRKPSSLRILHQTRVPSDQGWAEERRAGCRPGPSGADVPDGADLGFRGATYG